MERRGLRRYWAVFAVCVLLIGLAWLYLRGKDAAQGDVPLQASQPVQTPVKASPIGGSSNTVSHIEKDIARLVARDAHRVENTFKHSIDCLVETAESDVNPEFLAEIESAQSYDEFGSHMIKIRPSRAASVRVTLRGESISKDAVTNEGGGASFSALPPGSYEVTAEGHPPMVGSSERVTVGQGAISVVNSMTIRKQGPREGDNFDTFFDKARVTLTLFPPTLASITRPVSIKGRVLDASGRPIAGAKVTGTQMKLLVEHIGPEGPDLRVEVSSVTSADGTYELAGYKPSELLDTAYSLIASGAAVLLESVDVRVQADGIAPSDTNMTRVLLVTEPLLESALKLKTALLKMNRAALHPRIREEVDKTQSPLSLPASHGNTIMVGDITLK